MQLGAGGERVAQVEEAGIKQADDIARIGVFDGLALIGHELLGLLELDLLVRAGMVNRHALLELAADHAHKGQTVAVGGVHDWPES